MTRRVAAGYLTAQAALAVVWWVGLRASDDLRGWFELDPGQPRVLDAFAIADLVVFAGGSVVTALALARRAAWAPLAAGATAGGAAYATLYLLGWVLLGGHGWAGVPPMVAATGVTAAIAITTHRSP